MLSRQFEQRVRVVPLGQEHLAWIDELLGDGYTVRIRATGESMAPSIRSGDYVWLRRSTRGPALGDVVLLLEHGSRPLIHRVINVEPNGLQTRGDASCHPDAWVPLAHVLGRAVHVESRRRIRRQTWFGPAVRAIRSRVFSTS